jgi:acyl-lipid omega-6 desaturase (Delta-12 desaturase)
MLQQISRNEVTFCPNSIKVLPVREQLIQAISPYAEPDACKATWQLMNTFVPYLGLWALMIFCVQHDVSYWVTLLAAIVASAFLVRMFILFHDCCHQAFFPSKLANRIVGYIAGVMTFTAFEDWQRSHVIHHSTSGNLDRRGMGDIWTLTVNEYLSAPRLKRMAYRIFRNPLLLFTIMPLVLFLVVHRFPSFGAKQRELFSILLTNAVIVALILVMSLTIGLQNYLLIQLPVIMLAASIGTWLFYIQHQYEDTYWSRQPDWDLTRSGLEGSSYYKLPNVLQWLVGHIGLHHIHHVKANVPNYNLQRCQDEVALLQAVMPITMRKSLNSLWLNLWDEHDQKLVSFRSIRMKPRLQSQSDR